MMDERKCATCGATYNYCPNCATYASQPSWRTMWDTEECKNVYNIISLYNMGRRNKDEVKEYLESIGVTDGSKYVKTIQKALNTIGVFKRNKKKVEISTKNENMDIDLIEKIENVEEVPVINSINEEDISDITLFEGISVE